MFLARCGLCTHEQRKYVVISLLYTNVKKKVLHTLICPLFFPLKTCLEMEPNSGAGGGGAYRVPYASARTCRDAAKCLSPRTADVLDLSDPLLLRRVLR